MLSQLQQAEDSTNTSTHPQEIIIPPTCAPIRALARRVRRADRVVHAEGDVMVVGPELCRLPGPWMDVGLASAWFMLDRTGSGCGGGGGFECVYQLCRCHHEVLLGAFPVFDCLIDLILRKRSHVFQFYRLEWCSQCASCREGGTWMMNMISPLVGRGGRRCEVLVLREFSPTLPPSNAFALSPSSRSMSFDLY